ncbi:MAG: fatty acid desaturase [Oleiphilaceae bacterium]|nr:fatty acid desaturase [Oleiphilaceae bacterium]
MEFITKHLRHSDALLPLVTLVVYILATYLGGWLLMAQAGWLMPALGVLACAHSMILASYLVHECAHNTLFKSSDHNTTLGQFANWLTGGCYGTYEDVRYKHMRHHVDNADPISFDYRGWLRRHPLVEKTVFALEWLYIPAVDYLMHGVLMTAPFTGLGANKQRRRTLAVIITRTALFGLLAVWSLKAAALYVVAYSLLLLVLRFLDAYQHNYEIVLNLDDPKADLPHKGDRDYENHNTYSNLISRRWPVLNLLVLNFCYHNAHHVKPTLPWYKLPALHDELYGSHYQRSLSLKDQLRSYHGNRLEGIYAETYGQVEVPEAVAGGSAVPVYGLSFLTAF